MLLCPGYSPDSSLRPEAASRASSTTMSSAGLRPGDGVVAVFVAGEVDASSAPAHAYSSVSWEWAEEANAAIAGRICSKNNDGNTLCTPRNGELETLLSKGSAASVRKTASFRLVVGC